MTTRLRHASFGFAVVLTALGALFSACNNESEGYPCSQQNGNQDCADNLQCIAPPNMSATNAHYVCCPLPGTAPTTPECTVTGQIDAGNPAVPDSSVDTSTGHDGSSEATTEASADSASGDSSATGDSAAATDAGGG